MRADNNLERFLEAQETAYARALTEIRNGRKQSHWMWYIFPQISGLGFSDTAIFYSIHNLQEARDYLDHPILGVRLIDISTALLAVAGKSANQILGSPDDLKLRSSMTLFNVLENTNPVFKAVLDRYFDGEPDPRTLSIIKSNLA